MKCIICHGEDIQLAEVREEFKIAGDIIYVPIRVPVCATCGEKYYDRRTMRYLEEIERKLMSGGLDLQEVGRVMELAG